MEHRIEDDEDERMGGVQWRRAGRRITMARQQRYQTLRGTV